METSSFREGATISGIENYTWGLYIKYCQQMLTVNIAMKYFKQQS